MQLPKLLTLSYESFLCEQCCPSKQPEMLACEWFPVITKSSPCYKRQRDREGHDGRTHHQHVFQQAQVSRGTLGPEAQGPHLHLLTDLWVVGCLLWGQRKVTGSE